MTSNRMTIDRRAGGPRRGARGFTLVELIISILVLGIGLVALAAVFPAGIAQQQFANDDVLGRVVADHALSMIRSKVSPEDFGTYEQFFMDDARATGANGAPELPHRTAGGAFTKGAPGDWHWKRPGFVLDNPATSIDEGKVDVFSWEALRLQTGAGTAQPVAAGFPLWAVNSALGRANEFPAGRTPTATAVGTILPPERHTIYGIPFNRERFDSDLNVGTVETEVFAYTNTGVPMRKPREPAFFLTQQDRTWPQEPGVRTSPGRYYWECMFRRFQGKIWVAIFVYRVAPPGGEPRVYSVRAPGTGVQGQPQGNTNLPPLPVTLRLDNGSNQSGAKPVWAALSDLPAGADKNSAYNPASDSESWQLPGQWIVDTFNNVHRVVNGRRVRADGPVRFARPVPAVPNVPAIVGMALPGDQPATTIDEIWYLPARDAAGNTLIPVFCTVQEL